MPENKSIQEEKQAISEKQKTPTWAIVVIAVLSVLLFSLIIWIITHKVDSIDLGMTITPENWFSYLVTLIGLLITLFVGFQIFNSIEVRRELKDAECKYEELKNKNEQFISASRSSQSELENNMGAFKLDLSKKFNDTEMELMKEQSENARKVDWYLKDIKKDYWEKLNEANRTIEETKETQDTIKKEMQDIVDKWEIIKEKQDKSRNAMCQAFLMFENQTNDNELKSYMLLSSIDIYPEIGKGAKPLNTILDKLIKNLSEVDKFSSNLVFNSTNCLKNIHLDNIKNKEDIQRKINKILYLIDEKTPLNEEKG